MIMHSPPLTPSPPSLIPSRCPPALAPRLTSPDLPSILPSQRYYLYKAQNMAYADGDAFYVPELVLSLMPRRVSASLLHSSDQIYLCFCVVSGPRNCN